jgi:hypothetical protein
MKRHFELEIETLQNAPRDEAKLRELLKLKEKENEQEAIKARRDYMPKLELEEDEEGEEKKRKKKKES